MTGATALPPLRRECTHAIAVTYNPDEDFGRNLHAICSLVPRVVVVDNGSAADIRGRIRDAASASGAEVIWNPSNLGLATALNQGVRHSRAHQASWFLFFDQDSYPYPGLLERFGAAVDALQPGVPLGILGCAHDDPSVPAARRGAAGAWWREVPTVITAGSAVAASVYERVGPFREDFFIDLVDVEYCLRARSRGLTVVEIAESQLAHRVGRATVHRLPWKVTGASNHSASRRYYAMRNHVVVARQYAFEEPGWVAWSVAERIKGLLLMLLFEQDRWSKLVHSARGLVHGLRGRMGPLSGDGDPA